MTAKDYLKQFKVSDKVIWVMDNGEKKSDFCLSDMMNEFARHIAEQAVDGERELRQALLYENKIAHSVINSILTRIKQLTEQK